VGERPPDEPVRIPIEEALDLHPFRPDETAAVVADYVEAAAGKGLTEVRLIHGRGRGVQRAIIRTALTRSPFVLSFEDATPDRGGWGATVAHLKPPPLLLDLLIVGAGPAGIALGAEAVAAGIASERILILEKGDVHSFTIRKYYPEEKLVTANYKGHAAVCHGVLCIPDLSKRETLSYLDRAIESNRLRVRYNEPVWAIRPREGCFLVETAAGVHRARTCAVAIGILGRPQKPGWPIPGTLKGQITYDVTSKTIRGDVLVVGGGDSASEYAQYLAQEGCRVTLSYRGTTFHRMNAINRESLEALEDRGTVRLLRGSNVARVEPREGRPHVTFTEGGFPPATFDHIVLALGGTTPENFLKAVGIDFDGATPVLKDGYETSLPGLFLLGDLTAGRIGGSIITAFNSANEAMQVLCERHLNCALPPRRKTTK
jgi:thioredoxin reductase (NADPH)